MKKLMILLATMMLMVACGDMGSNPNMADESQNCYDKVIGEDDIKGVFSEYSEDWYNGAWATGTYKASYTMTIKVCEGSYYYGL